MGNLECDVLASVVRHGLAEMVPAARETDWFPACLRSLVGVVRADGASL